jgi:hypothetical protein
MSYGWRSKQVVKNFIDEHFLPEETIHEINLFILGNSALTFTEIKTQLQQIIRRHLLKGESIRVQPYPEKVGFAIPQDLLMNFLMREYGFELFDLDVKNIEKFLLDCQTGMVSQRYHECLFKALSKLLWLTWDERTQRGISGKNDPFWHLQSDTSQEIQVVLGLGDVVEDRPLYLITISTENIDADNFVLFRPTFCDADFNEYYGSAPQNFDAHGLTHFRDKTIKINNIEYKIDRHPECIALSRHIRARDVVELRYLTT